MNQAISDRAPKSSDWGGLLPMLLQRDQKLVKNYLREGCKASLNPPQNWNRIKKFACEEFCLLAAAFASAKDILLYPPQGVVRIFTILISFDYRDIVKGLKDIFVAPLKSLALAVYLLALSIINVFDFRKEIYTSIDCHTRKSVVNFPISKWGKVSKEMLINEELTDEDIYQLKDMIDKIENQLDLLLRFNAQKKRLLGDDNGDKDLNDSSLSDEPAILSEKDPSSSEEQSTESDHRNPDMGNLSDSILTKTVEQKESLKENPIFADVDIQDLKKQREKIQALGNVNIGVNAGEATKQEQEELEDSWAKNQLELGRLGKTVKARDNDRRRSLTIQAPPPPPPPSGSLLEELNDKKKQMEGTRKFLPTGTIQKGLTAYQMKKTSLQKSRENLPMIKKAQENAPDDVVDIYEVNQKIVKRRANIASDDSDDEWNDDDDFSEKTSQQSGVDVTSSKSKSSWLDMAKKQYPDDAKQCEEYTKKQQEELLKQKKEEVPASAAPMSNSQKRRQRRRAAGPNSSNRPSPNKYGTGRLENEKAKINPSKTGNALIQDAQSKYDKTKD